MVLNQRPVLPAQRPIAHDGHPYTPRPRIPPLLEEVAHRRPRRYRRPPLRAPGALEEGL